MIAIIQQIKHSEASTNAELKKEILNDRVLVQLLSHYPEMDDEELIKKYTLLKSSKKYQSLKVKMANRDWDSAYCI